MDTDIQSEMPEISEIVQEVGEAIGEPEVDVYDLMDLREALHNVVETLDNYIAIQIDRYITRYEEES